MIPVSRIPWLAAFESELSFEELLVVVVLVVVVTVAVVALKWELFAVEGFVETLFKLKTSPLMGKELELERSVTEKDPMGNVIPELPL